MPVFAGFSVVDIVGDNLDFKIVPPDDDRPFIEVTYNVDDVIIDLTIDDARGLIFHLSNLIEHLQNYEDNWQEKQNKTKEDDTN